MTDPVNVGSVFPTVIVSGEAAHGSTAYQQRLDELGLSGLGRSNHLLLEAVDSRATQTSLSGAHAVAVSDVEGSMPDIAMGTEGQWDYPVQVYAQRSASASASVVAALRELGFQNVVDLGVIGQPSGSPGQRRLTIDTHPTQQATLDPVLHVPGGDIAPRMHQVVSATSGDWSWPITVYGLDETARAAAATLRQLGFTDVSMRATPEEPLLIDLRDAVDYNAYHLPRARSIPIGDIQSRMAEIVRATSGNWDHPIHVYCSRGDRSRAATKTLRDLGFSSVSDLGALDRTVRPVTRLELVEAVADADSPPIITAPDGAQWVRLGRAAWAKLSGDRLEGPDAAAVIRAGRRSR